MVGWVFNKIERFRFENVEKIGGKRMNLKDKNIILSEKAKEIIALDSRLQAIKRFNECDFGKVSNSEEICNLDASDLKQGSVYGVYMTPDGDEFILVYVYQLKYAFIYTSHEEPFYDARFI